MTVTRMKTYAWIILSAITIVSWWLAPGQSSGSTAVASVPITIAVVLLGFIKGRLIIQYFMEIRTAPRWLKVSTDAGSPCCGPRSSASTCSDRARADVG